MKRLITIPVAAGVLLTAPLALGQFYGVDDNPLAPIMGPPGFGMGAENPYGYALPPVFPSGVAPSPILGPAPGLSCFDADVITSVGGVPVVHMVAPTPGAHYLDSLSLNTNDYNVPRTLRLGFSVDRLTVGRGAVPGPPPLPPTDVNLQAIPNNEQPSDVFRSTNVFVSPLIFVGVAPAGFGYQGPLPTQASLAPTQDNMQHFDQTFFGLQTMGPVLQGTHDNIEQYEREIIDGNGDQLYDRWGYVTMYPDNVPMLPPPPPPPFPQQPIVTPADIFDIAPGTPSFPVAPAIPWANYTQMGLDQGFDSVDALVVYDNGAKGGLNNGGPGVEPGLDYALFSLAPGSQSLAQFTPSGWIALSPSDVFFTNFTTGFWLYADARDLGLLPGQFVVGPSGEFVFGDNLDALEVACASDINWDGAVDFNDLLQVLHKWGSTGMKEPTDVDDDKFVGFSDLVFVLADWGPCS